MSIDGISLESVKVPQLSPETWETARTVVMRYIDPEKEPEVSSRVLSMLGMDAT